MEAKDGSSGFGFAGRSSNVVPQNLLEYTFGDRVGKVEFSEGPANQKLGRLVDD